MGYIIRDYARHQTPRTPVILRQAGTFSWLHGIVLNLSRSGLMLHCAAPLENGSEIELEFSSVDKAGKKQVRKFKAFIVWKKSNLYGVKFKART